MARKRDAAADQPEAARASYHSLRLDPENVPASVRFLIPAAAQYGFPDEMLRLELLSRAPRAETNAIYKALKAHQDEIDDWIGGPEGLLERPSLEYTAFQNLRVGIGALRRSRR